MRSELRKRVAAAIALAVTAGCIVGTEPPTAPDAPDVFLATAVDSNHVQLDWTHSGSNIDGFRLERRLGGAAFAEVGVLTADVRQIVDEGLSADTPYGYRLRACRGVLCSVATPIASVTTQPSADRYVDDRADDIDGAQVHVMYVLPYDAVDRNFDRNGTLAASVSSFHGWFIAQSDLQIRFDTHGGALDVTGYRLQQTDAAIRASGAFVLDVVLAELTGAGKLQAGKTYLIYYDGGSTYACGGARWPGIGAAMYLKGTPPGASCGGQSFVSSPTAFPQYWEFAALHDLLHTMGIVSVAAPNHVDGYPAHVPEQNDLMYSGPGPWIIGATTVIDVGGDDYFGVGVAPGLANLLNSPLVEPATVAVRAQFRLSGGEQDTARSLRVERLPVHAPFVGRQSRLRERFE